MQKRILIFFCSIIFFIGLGIFRLYSLSHAEYLQAAANLQNSYKLKISSMRGTIYDCKKIPLICTQEKSVAVVLPSVDKPEALFKILAPSDVTEYLPLLKSGKPFCVPIKDVTSVPSHINTFKINQRYADLQFAPHLIGYIDKSGKNGICGIEKAFNDYLNSCTGQLNLIYKINALGKVISKNDIKIDDTMYKKSGGVVLTIDKNIQQIAQTVGEKYLKKGAIIVSEVPSCAIRACVSIPSFSQNDIPSAINDPSSPLLNRAFASYNIGSIFKLITAAAAIDNNISPDTLFPCTGSINIYGLPFHCYNSTAHGDINMSEAIAHSCNTYFINLAQKIGPEKILTLAKDLGFGSSTEFAPNFFSSCGNVPEVESINSLKALANISFGQGALMASPMQVAALINTIASDGKYTSPQLILGLVNESLNFIQHKVPSAPKQLISKKCAKYLKNSMYDAVEHGSAHLGKPTNHPAGAKTGSAQTGIKSENRFATQAWFAGFYPYENPKYSIVVLSEDSTSGGAACGPIFKAIANQLV